MLLGLFILNSRAQKRVNLVLEVDMTKEGERDARQLQIAGSLLRKGCLWGGLHTFALGGGGGVAPGNLETGLLPVFSFTLDSITRLHLQELLICLRPNILQRGNAAGWERVGTQDSLGHILCSGAHLSLLISLGQW